MLFLLDVTSLSEYKKNAAIPLPPGETGKGNIQTKMKDNVFFTDHTSTNFAVTGGRKEWIG